MLIFKLTLNICLRLLFLLAFLQNVYADEFDYYAHIKKYTQCEALQNVIANISNQSEKEFYPFVLLFQASFQRNE